MENKIVRFASDVFHPIEKCHSRVIKVVNDDNVVIVLLNELDDGMGANVAEASCYKHVFFLLRRFKSFLCFLPVCHDVNVINTTSKDFVHNQYWVIYSITSAIKVRGLVHD